MRVALYIRVSTEEQAVHGLSVDDQKDSLQKWAEENKHKVVDYYIDAGVRIPAGSPKQGSPQSQRIAGFSLFFNALQAFRNLKMLQSFSIFCKQKQHSVIEFACCFACDLLAIKKPLGYIRAAFVISIIRAFMLNPDRSRT